MVYNVNLDALIKINLDFREEFLLPCAVLGCVPPCLPEASLSKLTFLCLRFKS